MKKCILLIGWLCFILLYRVELSAQAKKLDSLLTLIKTDREDTNKIKHLSAICKTYFVGDEYDKAMAYGNQSLELAKKLGYKKGIAQAYNYKGIIFDYQGNYPEALKNHFASLKIKEEIKREYPNDIQNKKGIIASYNNLGIIYNLQEKYDEALRSHLSALKIRKEINDRLGMASSYNNIGATYMYQGNYPAALKSHIASLKISQEIDDKSGIANSYDNIGVIYDYMNNYSDAIKNYLLALHLFEGLDDQSGMASCNINIGQLYVKHHKLSEANVYLAKGLFLSKEIGRKESIKNSYEGLYAMDSASGNYKDAFAHHKLFIVYRDSLINEESKQKSIQTSMQYEFDKKELATKAEREKQDVINREEKQKQRFVIYGVAAVLIIVVVFSIFLYRRFKLTQKQKHIIELQKDEVSRQKHLVEEHQKEIIDSITYAKRLQQAILPSVDEIKRVIPNHFIYYKPKDIVAGDFYWMQYLDDTTFIAAADSTGHGVPGAMVSVVCSNALNRAVKEFGLRETGKILDKTRELVLETFEKSGEEIKDGMDISLLSIGKNKEVQWSGANNPLWYIRTSVSSRGVENKELIEIKPDKQPIGKTEIPKPFLTHVLPCSENDTFFLFTDGFADQFGGPKGKKIKYKQLEDLLMQIHEQPLDEQKQLLAQTFDAWKGSLEQVDDLTIIGIRI